MKKTLLLFLALIFETPSFAEIISPARCDPWWTDYVRSDKCPADKPFLSEELHCWGDSKGNIHLGAVLGYKCVSCFEEEKMAIQKGHEKDFEICTNRETLPYGEDSFYSVIKCPADKPLRDHPFGDCMPCATEKWMAVSEEKCRLCGDMRTMLEDRNKWYCVLNKSPDPERPLVDNYPAHSGETLLFSCDELEYVIATKENCDLCPNRRHSEFDFCVLKECPTGYFMDAESCKSCDDIEAGFSAHEGECLKCPNRDSNCDFKVCPAGSFRETELGFCQYCAHQDDYPATQEECQRCPNREYKEGQCVFKECPQDYFDVPGLGWCMKCQNQEWYQTTEEECAKCPNREYISGDCVLKETE